MVVGRIIHEGCKIIRLLKIPYAHLLQMSAMQLKTIPILVIADTSDIRSNYYMAGHYCYVHIK